MTAWIRWSIAGVCIVFGIATLVAGGRALFGPADVRAALGVILYPLLWFNFLMGGVYCAVGLAVAWQVDWARWAAAAIAGANGAAAIAVYVYWLLGNPVEPRTLGAVLIRLGVWAAIAGILFRGGRVTKSGS